MFLSSFAPTVVCGSELSAKEVATTAAEVEDEVGVDIADALDVLTFKDDVGIGKVLKETRGISRSRHSTPGSTTFESKKLLLEEQELFYPKNASKIAVFGARRLRHQQPFDDRTLKRIARRVQRRLSPPFERELFRLPNLRTFVRSNRYQMVLREFSQNLAKEFKTIQVATQTTEDPRFRAWAILAGCEEAYQSIIHVGREKVSGYRNSKMQFAVAYEDVERLDVIGDLVSATLALRRGARLTIQCGQPGALQALVSSVELDRRRISSGRFQPLIRPLTLPEVTGGGRDPIESIFVIDIPVTIKESALEPSPTNFESPKEGYLMYTEPDDVLDTADDPWKTGYFQIRMNTLFLTNMERHPSHSDATPRRQIPKKSWTLSPIAERPGSTGAVVSYASEVVVFRPNALSLSLMPSEGPVLNLAASCEQERAEWACAIERASKFKGCVVTPENAISACSKETIVAAPCVCALTATSILFFHFSGRMITNSSRIFLVDIIDIVAKGTEVGRLVVNGRGGLQVDITFPTASLRNRFHSDVDSLTRKRYDICDIGIKS